MSACTGAKPSPLERVKLLAATVAVSAGQWTTQPAASSSSSLAALTHQLHGMSSIMHACLHQ